MWVARLTRLFKYLVLYPSSVKSQKYNRSLEGPCTYISDHLALRAKRYRKREQDIFRVGCARITQPIPKKNFLLAPVSCSRFLHQLEYGHGALGNSNILLQLIRNLSTRALSRLTFTLSSRSSTRTIQKSSFSLEKM